MKTQLNNLKIAMIYGSNTVDGVIQDGHIETIYKTTPDMYHLFYLSQFLKNYEILNEHDFKNALYKNDVMSLMYELQFEIQLLVFSFLINI